MLFQWQEALFFFLWLVLATVIVTLILYIAVILIVSKTKASDKKFLIILLALIVVLVLPIIFGAINTVLSTLGNFIAFSGTNYLPLLTSVIGFLIILVLVKYLLDVQWDNSVWISLLTLFILFLLYTMIPEFAVFLGFTI